MEVSIKGNPKEIAALVLELQERRGCTEPAISIDEATIANLQQKLDRVQGEFSP